MPSYFLAVSFKGGRHRHTHFKKLTWQTLLPQQMRQRQTLLPLQMLPLQMLPQQRRQQQRRQQQMLPLQRRQQQMRQQQTLLPQVRQRKLRARSGLPKQRVSWRRLERTVSALEPGFACRQGPSLFSESWPR